MMRLVRKASGWRVRSSSSAAGMLDTLFDELTQDRCPDFMSSRVKLNTRFAVAQPNARGPHTGAAWAHDRYHLRGGVSRLCAESLEPVGPISSEPNSICELFIGSGQFDFSARETRPGWTIGIGLEWTFWKNWSARLEFDHYDFGTRRVFLLNSLDVTDLAPQSTPTSSNGSKRLNSESAIALNLGRARDPLQGSRDTGASLIARRA